MTEGAILEGAKAINPADVAGEVGQWLLDNVENYVDNHRHVYRLYLTVGAANSMSNTGALQLLYMSIPSPEDSEDKEGLAREGRCLDALDDVTTRVKAALQADKASLAKLHERLIYYYEMTGFSSESGPIVQQFDGYVELFEFVYEPLSMEVVTSAGVDVVDTDGNLIGQSGPKKVVKREVMPEGFAVEFELKHWKRPPQEMY